VAARVGAIDRVADETDLEIVSHAHLSEADNILAPDCKYFDDSERTNLLRYCNRADPRKPRGKGACGLLVVFPDSCPNNSIPVLHAANNRWEGLFRRYN
jgi:hypothetical protein